MMESIFWGPALIGYLVKCLNEKFPDNLVGKTVVQKMMYLLIREGVGDFRYSMYHYGPYSSAVSGELNFAESSEIVDINWIEEKGYSIKPGSTLSKFEDLLTEEDKEKVNEISVKFGKFNAGALSLIATALFLEDNYDVAADELPQLVHRLKEKYDVSYIKKILKEAEIIEDISVPF